MLPLGFFQNRVFSASSAVVLMVGFAMFGIFYFVTLYFQNVLGYSALQAGVRSLPLTMMVIFVAPIAGRLSGKVAAALPDDGRHADDDGRPAAAVAARRSTAPTT